jgi:hypothetical protein
MPDLNRNGNYTDKTREALYFAGIEANKLGISVTEYVDRVSHVLGQQRFDKIFGIGNKPNEPKNPKMSTIDDTVKYASRPAIANLEPNQVRRIQKPSEFLAAYQRALDYKL